MSSIKKIKAPIREEMDKFEPFFKASMKTSVPLLDIITNYIIRRKGKQMRPMFVFLSAKLNGTVSDASYTAAGLIELLHTATLIHDDVVDESYKRRGFFSINALWKSKVAVLVGDFLLSKGLMLAVEHKQYELLDIVSNAVKEMAEGELLQMEKSRRLDITEDVYYEIINKKTATLIAACLASGAKSVGADAATVEKMHLFGTKVGIAFQIKDDLFDFQVDNKTGKPAGNDIQEKKMTLPLIFALNNADKKTQKHLLKIIRKQANKPEKLKEVVDFVAAAKGLDYAEQKMNEFKNEALSLLADYPPSDAKEALIELVEYSISRSK